MIAEEGYPLHWTRVGSMASLFFTPDPVTDWHSAARSDREAFKRFFWGMLDRGFYLAPSPFEALFLSFAHTPTDIDDTLEATRGVLGEVFGREEG
jgi:glutamate-1-semialdehyde 2,1-aminomutase